MSQRGNLNWGKPYVPVFCSPSAFERQVEQLGLCPDQYEASLELRKWCRRNANTYFVPEDLLRLWGIKVNDCWGPITGAVVYW
jgi:hypothetical protein